MINDIIEAIYIIFMYNYFKTSISIHHPFEYLLNNLLPSSTEFTDSNIIYPKSNALTSSLDNRMYMIIEEITVGTIDKMYNVDCIFRFFAE